VKAVLKLALLAVIGAAVAGLVVMARRPGEGAALPSAEWPEVARNPAANDPA